MIRRSSAELAAVEEARQEALAQAKREAAKDPLGWYTAYCIVQIPCVHRMRPFHRTKTSVVHSRADRKSRQVIFFSSSCCVPLEPNQSQYHSRKTKGQTMLPTPNRYRYNSTRAIGSRRRRIKRELYGEDPSRAWMVAKPNYDYTRLIAGATAAKHTTLGKALLDAIKLKKTNVLAPFKSNTLLTSRKRKGAPASSIATPGTGSTSSNTGSPSDADSAATVVTPVSSRNRTRDSSSSSNSGRGVWVGEGAPQAEAVRNLNELSLSKSEPVCPCYATVMLPPGRTMYKFVVCGEEIFARDQVSRISSSGTSCTSSSSSCSSSSSSSDSSSTSSSDSSSIRNLVLNPTQNGNLSNLSKPIHYKYPH